jgi:type IV secretory pathway VirB2 component (pilin)
MALRNVGLLMALIVAIAAHFIPAQAQDGGSQPNASDQPLSAIGSDYAAQCALNGVRCKLVYGDDIEKAKAAPNATTLRDIRSPAPQEPLISGPVAVVLVLVALAVIIGLVMRFGNGGVLLSSAPRDVKKRQGEAPESWRNPAAEAEEKPLDFLQRIASMADRRQALVLLLRACLLHAADLTGTRLFRSDTERAVFARLPQTMPDRDRLENLLTEVELVHYGGRTVAESQFDSLLTVARRLLSSGRLRHA